MATVELGVRGTVRLVPENLGEAVRVILSLVIKTAVAASVVITTATILEVVAVIMEAATVGVVIAEEVVVAATPEGVAATPEVVVRL